MRELRAAAAVFLGLVLVGPAAAQTWPSRPIKMIVGFEAGGGTDVLGRIIAQGLSEVLGKPVVVENVSGAGGMVGGARAANAQPDGYTILLSSRADAINQSLYKRPLYNLVRDLVPVVLIGDQPSVVITRKGIPVHTMPEFIDYVTKNQATLKYATAGPGSSGTLDCMLLNSAIGVDVTPVPYRGSGPGMQALAGGFVDYICTLTGSALPLIQANAVNPIAVLTRDRTQMFPDIPTAWEQGFRKFEGSTWFGIHVPKGTPQDIVNKLHDAAVTAMESPQIQKQLLTGGATVVPPDRRSIEYYSKFIDQEIEKNGAAIRAAGLSID